MSSTEIPYAPVLPSSGDGTLPRSGDDGKLPNAQRVLRDAFLLQQIEQILPSPDWSWIGEEVQLAAEVVGGAASSPYLITDPQFLLGPEPVSDPEVGGLGGTTLGGGSKIERGKADAAARHEYATLINENRP